MSPLLGLSGFGGGTLRFGSPTTEISDEYFKYVTLLLHGDGANAAQNNTFLDSSTNNFSITRNGNTTQGTFSPYGNNWGVTWPGANENSGINLGGSLLGSSNFTIEFWINIQGGSAATMPIVSSYDWYGGFTNGGIFISWESSTNDISFKLFTGGGSNFFDAPTGSASSGSNSITKGQWHHVACTRNGASLQIFIDGVSKGTGTLSSNTALNYNSRDIYIGRNFLNNSGSPTDTRSFTGSISNFRLVVGSVLYTSGFTPSTVPLTAVTNTQRLVCHTNRFIDGSSNNFAITASGDVRVDKFNPFGRSAAYSSGTEGASGYFDGSGDYLSTGANSAFGFGSGDFTMECWFYKTTSNLDVLLDTRINAGGSQFGLALYVQGNTLKAGNDAERISGGTLVNNSWNHCALVRSGNNISLYLNGSRTNTTAFSTTLASSASCWIGSSAFSEFAGGYISNARVIKGTAIYTGTTYTIPTSPLTAISNTSLLLNFTNASIIDNSGLSVLETVGNAQLDTAIKKFGTGSLKFDGSGDYLTAGNPPSLDLRSGNFTMESWIYPVNVTGNKAICGTWLNQQGILYLVDSTLSFAWAPYSINIPLLSAGTVSANQWSHVAVTRSGNTFKLFVNGTETTSTTSATNATTFTTPFSVGSFIVDGTYTNFFNGYIDDLRVTKGIARYTANFTPPTRAFPNK